MKTEERAVPELVEASREETNPRGATGGMEDVGDEDRTGELSIPEDWAALENIDVEHSGKVSGPINGPETQPHPADAQAAAVAAARTPPAATPRTARSTLTSPISAIMAESMRKERDGVPMARDPFAPEFGAGEHTRRIGDSDKDSDKHDASSAYTVELVDDGNSERRQRAAQHIDRARACMEAGDLAAAARAAEEALEESDHAAPPGIVEVIEPARPLLSRIFTAYVGPLTEMPVLARRTEEIAALRLDARLRGVLARVDGRTSLAQIFDGARIPAGDALRVAAALLRAGLIRVV